MESDVASPLPVEGTHQIKGWCPMCRSRCGSITTVTDGRVVKVERDPDHPTGRAFCAKGSAAPELVHSPDRLLHPVKRTRPKGDPDPGWARISWDEALDLVAGSMLSIAERDGARAIAFGITTGSGTQISDGLHLVERLMHAFGSPNNVYGTEICNWHKDVATTYTYGHGIGTPDLDRTGCVLLWGHNPNTSWIAQAERVSSARARGAKVVVVDPRRAGPAVKAHHWLRVRPGTDGALALGIAGTMIEHRWFDEDFVRRWTNGPFLVIEGEERLLTEADLVAGGRVDAFVVHDPITGSPRVVEPRSVDGCPAGSCTLEGTIEVETLAGPVRARPVFDHYARRCQAYPPARVEAVTGVPAIRVVETARTLWEARPVSYYAWSGVGQHTNATQTDRAISCLYALTGCIGGKGGNVVFEQPPVADLSGRDLVEPSVRGETLGLQARPLGPPRDGWCTSTDFYRAVLEHDPYPVRALLTFGADLLMGHAGAQTGARALAALDFHVHADLFINATAGFADVVLPVNSGWEREALRPGFEVTPQACARVQMRQPAIASLGESRDDGWIAFELARRLGLGNRFFNGDRDAALREALAPTGIALEDLRAAPDGITVTLDPSWDRHLHEGFPTPSGRIEIWSERFRIAAQSPLPEYREPAMSPISRPDLRERFPLVLTSAKSHQYCQGQHRNLPRLRRTRPDPVADLHPDTAATRRVGDGDWISIETPAGRLLARARLRDWLDPSVVVAQHGWWQGCDELGARSYPAYGDGSANLNAAIDDEHCDPISGSVALRSYLCEVTLAGEPSTGR